MIITKEQVLETMHELPEQFSLDELIEQLTAYSQDRNVDDLPLATTSKEKGKIPALRHRIQMPMTNEAIEQQLKK